MRFAISRHDHPFDHLDVFLERPGGADHEALATWRAPGRELASLEWPGVTERLPDHRRAYLDHDGGVSGGRGSVTRLAAGDMHVERWEDRLIVVDLEAEEARGRLTLFLDQGGRWRSAWRPRGGMFVALEGIDGSGKSSAGAAVAAELQGSGRTVWSTREPTDVGVGAVVRERLAPGSWQDPLAMANAFAADRAEHLYGRDGILHRRGRGEVVLCDRYKLSSIVYQSEAGVDEGYVRALNEGFPDPDLTVLFDLPVDLALDRLAAADDRGRDLFERRLFLEGVRRRYLASHTEAGELTVVLEASAGRDEVARALLASIGLASTGLASIERNE